VNPVLLTGRLVARTGPRGPVLTGLWLLAAAGAVMGGSAASGAPYPVLAAGLLATGFGVSLALPALTTAVVTLAPQGAAGAAGGLYNAVRQGGATLGVAVLGAFVTVAPGAGSGGGQGIARSLFVAAGVCAAAGLVVGLDTPRRRTRRAPSGAGG
jgi:DHA2 family methylenomycin A resistance protein-like MFS transporter